MNYRTITFKVPTFALPKLALPSLPFTVRIERKAQPAPAVKRTRKTKQAHA